MTGSENALNWIQISVSDIKKAKTFYETIFGFEMHTKERMGMQMTFFPAEDMNEKISGSLVQGVNHKPSADYADIGNMAYFIGSEGNTVALHSNK